MDINVRKVSDLYCEALIDHDRTSIDTGLLCHHEACELGLEFVSAAIDLFEQSGHIVEDQHIDLIRNVFEKYAK